MKRHALFLFFFLRQHHLVNGFFALEISVGSDSNCFPQTLQSTSFCLVNQASTSWLTLYFEIFESQLFKALPLSS